eukprot:782530-Karenia_brevis.AAC.1
MAPKTFKRPSGVMKKRPVSWDPEMQSPSKRRCSMVHTGKNIFAIDSTGGAAPVCEGTVGSEKVQKKVWLCKSKSGCTKKDGKRKQAQSGCR